MTMIDTDVTTIDVDAGLTSAVRSEDTHVERSAVGVVRGESVSFSKGVVGAVFARGDVSVSQGGGRAFVAGGDLSIEQGGGGMFVAGGNASIAEGGVGSMLALGEVRVERGGIGIALAREVEAGGGAIVGFAIAPKVEIQAGGRLILGLREAVVGGVVAGAMFALMTTLVRALRGR
jgi:hypothetical protein